MRQPNDIPEIDPKRCTGCGRCVAACREHCITLEVSGYRKYALLVLPQHCTGCGACVDACPVRALS